MELDFTEPRDGPFFMSFRMYPAEAEIIGRMVVGYGELEFILSQCVSAVLKSPGKAVKAMFRTRGEKQRLDIADALCRDLMDSAGLHDIYCTCLDAVKFCRQIRNLYAHAHWIVEPNGPLMFVDLEGMAKRTSSNLMINARSVEITELQEQEAYFNYTTVCLFHLLSRVDPDAAQTAEGRPIPWPKAIPKPDLKRPSGQPADQE